MDRRSFLASTLAAAVGGTAGCLGGANSPSYRSYGYASHNRGSAPDLSGPSDPVEQAWRLEDALGVQTPVIEDGTVFVASRHKGDSTVVALDTESGKERWEYRVEAPLGAQWTPAVADGTLFFIDRSGTAHAVDTSDGTEVWQLSLPRKQGPINAPIVTDDTLVFGLGIQTLLRFGGLYALETADGSVRWHKTPDTDAGAVHTPAYPAAAGDSVIYSSLTSDELRAVSTESGDSLWEADFAQTRGYSGVALTEDRAYLGGPQGYASVDRTTQALVWQFEGGRGYFPPTVTKDRAVITMVEDDLTGIRAVDPTGEELWTRTTGSERRPVPRTVVDGRAYLTTENHIEVRDVETGELRWTFGPLPQFFWTPVVLEDTIYISTSDGLLALRPT